MTGHQNVPVGTLHEQDRNGPVTVLRDYDTLLLDRWRLSRLEVRRLAGILNDALLDLDAAHAEMETVPWTPRCDGCNGYCGTCEAAVRDEGGPP